MPILRTDLHENLTTLVVTGQATFEELMEALYDFYAVTPSLNLLLDFRQGTISELPSEKSHLIAMYVTQVGHKRAGGKSAFVTESTVDYGMARMFETFIDMSQAPIKYQVFRDYDEAMAWLEGQT